MSCESKNCTDVGASCENSKDEALGTTSADALACNASTIDEIVNGTGTVLNRIGNQLNSLTQLESNYTITAINGGIWAAGQEFTAFNQYMVFSTVPYKPKVTTNLPYVVGATPDIAFVEPVSISLAVGTAISLNVTSTILTTDLDGISTIVVEGGLDVDDTFGGTFGSTGFIVGGSAGTVDVAAVKIYDINGVEFRLIDDKIRLETLNVPYTETAEIVLGYIIALRLASFTPDISPKYDVSSPFFGSDAFTTDWETSLHRGLATHNPENTELAFTLGQKSTVRGNKTFWEMDVQITSDKKAVVFHDATIDNLTDGTGTVTALTLAQLQAVKFTRTTGTIFEEGVRIPLLEDIIRAAIALGVKIQLEMKDFGSVVADDFKIMTDLVKKYKMSNSTKYSSFSIGDLETIKGFDNQGGLGLASSTEQVDITVLERLRKLALGSNRQPVIAKSLEQWADFPEDVAICHSFGIDCMGYTADKGREIQNLADIGIHKLHCNSNLR